MSRVYNFSAGPAQLPLEVLQQAQGEMLDWHHTGMSLMEIPHRSENFEKLAASIEQDLRDLLDIPSDYSVLFLHGGGRTQFAMVPMNLAQGYSSMAYVNTGVWSELAFEEAKRYGHAHVAACASKNNYLDLPLAPEWDLPADAAYVHYTDNETIQGIEYPAIPEISKLPLITDMSSNLLSKLIDVKKFGLIYACAQKNLGIAGITVVIIRKDLLERTPFDFTPSMLRYAVHAKDKSLYNTPATYPWYLTGLVFNWIKQQGGVAKMAEHNQRKAAKLYKMIDNSDFYTNKINPLCRSKMNVVFQLHDEALNQKFLADANKHGLINLKGHRIVGGMRASIYNAMPEKGVDALIEFMRDFERTA